MDSVFKYMKPEHMLIDIERILDSAFIVGYHYHLTTKQSFQVITRNI